MRPIIFSLLLWSISVVPSLQAAPDLTYLNIATQAAKWILSREEHERPNAGYWPSRADLPIEENAISITETPERWCFCTN
ncbi:MAG TPA: hypothetical protein VF020_07355 [Chthoniobacterales bacterium]